MSCDDQTVYLDNNYTFTAAPVKPSDTTGVLVPVTGLATVQGWFSLTEGGSAIATTTTAMPERTRDKGNYFGTLPQATLTAALSTYLSSNTTIYRVVDDGAGNRETVAVALLAVREG